MNKEPRYAKCEGCGKRIFYENATRSDKAGWSQWGKSKYGIGYCPDGIAWWCNKCRKEE